MSYICGSAVRGRKTKRGRNLEMNERNLEKSIVTGADRLIDVAEKTSKRDTRLAVAQLLLGAAALAAGMGMAESDFRQAVHIAIKAVWK
jgi:hypothetical protein